jgi:methionine biosynthesis protein MetW
MVAIEGARINTHRSSTERAGIHLRADLQVIAALIETGEKVLDLGCGDGTLLRHLLDTRAITGRGIEIDEASVLACVRRGVSVRQGNLQEGLHDYPAGSFDSAVLSQTLPYLNDPAFIIREMLRVSERAIVSFPNWGYWRCRLAFLLTGRIPQAPDLPQPWYLPPRARLLTGRDFSEFCTRHGFHNHQTIYLQGRQRIPDRIDKHLRATTVIFVLQ